MTSPSPADSFRRLLASPGALLAMAPMQDVTNLPYWRLLASYGGADFYVTEYFRVHSASRLTKESLQSITHNPTGQPVVGQLIGNDIPALVRTAQAMQRHPVAAVDFNLGCPAPIVYRKCAGGGLLREPGRIDAILGALRQAVHIPFTIKCRLGFDSAEGFDALLEIFARHSPDLVTIHGRIVPQVNSGPVRYDLIARAVQALPCPVLANGNIHSAGRARDVLQLTGARGVMAGRGALRNPWLFAQIRQAVQGQPVELPKGRDVLNYLTRLWEEVLPPEARDRLKVQMIKKFTNYLGEAVDPEGQFLHRTRRALTREDLFAVAAEFLDHDRPMPLVPFVEAALPFDPGS